MYPTVVDELHLPLIQSAALAHFAYCMCTEQGLVLVLFRGLPKAAMCLSLGFVSSHATCLLSIHVLQLCACQTEGHSPCLTLWKAFISQLGLQSDHMSTPSLNAGATVTVISRYSVCTDSYKLWFLGLWTHWCVVISSYLQGSSHFGVAPNHARVAYKVLQCKSHCRVMPVQWSRLGGVDSQGNMGAEHTLVAKLVGEYLNWFWLFMLRVFSSVQQLMLGNKNINGTHQHFCSCISLKTPACPVHVVK